MATSRKGGRGFLVMLGLAAAAPILFAVQIPPLVISLRLRDTAHVPHDVLIPAQEQVTRVYRAAGVETLWQTEQSLSAEPVSVRRDALTVAILSDAQAERLKRAVVDGDVGFSTINVGFAPVDASEGGRVAYVFYDRVQAVTGGNGLRRAHVLAIAMAHEIGHLLLPYDAHSETGLMRADWAETDLVDDDSLFFTAEQRALLHSRIVALHRP